jgi:hypothetical protein
MARRSVVYRILLSVDKLFNWYKGDPEETISETMGRLKKRENDPVAKVMSWLLDKVDKGHTEKAYDYKAHPSPQETIDRIIKEAMPMAEEKRKNRMFEVTIQQKVTRTATIFVEVGPDEDENKAHDEAVDFDTPDDFEVERWSDVEMDSNIVKNTKEIQDVPDGHEPDIMTEGAFGNTEIEE